MPVHPAPGGGYQWGNSGKVYTGPNAKARAQAQARAIYASGYRDPAAGARPAPRRPGSGMLGLPTPQRLPPIKPR